MSEATYRDATAELDAALSLIGRYRGECGLCGWPDARHRTADAMVGRLGAGETAWDVASDYGIRGVDAVYRVAITTLLADPRRHNVPQRVARAIAGERYAAMTEPAVVAGAKL